MEFEYKREEDGIVILRCYGNENRVRIPEEIEGCPVRRLESYAFSKARREEDKKAAICGEALLEVILPENLREIGNYAFYGCRKLESITMHHKISDIAGGAFTGCRFLRHVRVYMQDAWGYCLKDVISELRYEVRAELIYGEDSRAILLFPEYYEEAVENTPARLLETHFHGSGYSYRQCFRDGVLNYQEYDRLFLEAQAWESEDFCIELALMRLRYPWKLAQTAGGCYMAWLMEHREVAGSWCLDYSRNEDMEYLCSFIDWSAQELDWMIREANESGNLTIQSFLMEYKHRHWGLIKKSFDL